MKTQIEGLSIKDITKNLSLPEKLLLARPIIYFVFSRRRDIEAAATIDFSAFIFIIYSIIILYVGKKSLISSESGLGIRIIKNTPISIFITYMLLGLISMFWSVNPLLTFFRVFECFAYLIIIVAVIQNIFKYSSIKYVMIWSLLYCIWEIIWSVIPTILWTTNINFIIESNQYITTSFFFIALYFIPLKWYNYLIIIMSILSMSTVAYIGMGIGLISAFWANIRVKSLAYLGGFILVLACIIIGPYSILKNTIFFDKQEISLKETTGRNFLLEVSLESIKENPFGLGFSAGEPYAFKMKKVAAISAHNSVLSAGLGMGYLGIFLLILFLISMGLISFSQYIPENYKAMAIGSYFVSLLHCIGNPSVGTRVFGAWIPGMYIFVLICALYVYGKYYEPID